MHDKLSLILTEKRKEVDLLKKQSIIDDEITSTYTNKSFKKALMRKLSINIIAEIKRRSPSKGILAEISDPILLAEQYVTAGASAISVLTDHYGFGGSLEDMNNIAQKLIATDIPLLRKDFMIDPIQISEAKKFGANAILLIVAILDPDLLAEMLAKTRELNIDALVEVHTLEELKIALDVGAEIIGINNRNLKTFQVDTNTSFQLIQHIPKSIITVAESGIMQPKLATQYYNAGFSAVLVGEALVKSTDPSTWVAATREAHVN